ncbi:MAG: hypothetical protein WD771_09015 [Gemmatimonadaceae bacterium]
MRCPLAVTALLAALSPAAGAQGIRDAAVITSPTFTQYTFGSGVGERTISQFSLPVVLVVPFGERISVDISTAFANSEARVGDSTTSSISGLTDTQIRANFSVGEQALVFTVGVNLPTGQYRVPESQQEAAGQIGNDFLNYPISSMGNGLAGTGGVAYARPAGDWNLGFGASVRKSAEFTAFEVASTEFRFTPADEYRGRLSADRPVGDGQVSLGLTYSMFGEDLADNTTYSTGDRIIASGGWSFPFRGTDVFLSAWNLYRLAGERLGSDAPPENVFNVSAAVSIPLGEMLLQPSTEVRLWQADGARAGNLINLGARLRIGAGGFALYPQAGFTIGTLYSTADGSATDVSGLRASLTVRYN